MSVPTSTYKERRAPIRTSLEGCAKGARGVPVGRVREVVLPARERNYPAFLIERPREPLGVADEIFSRGVLPLLLDALRMERIDAMEVIGLRGHVFDGDALLLGLNDAGAVQACAVLQVVAPAAGGQGVAYIPNIYVHPDVQGQAISTGLVSVLLGLYRPRWLVCRTQQAVLAQSWAQFGCVYPTGGAVTPDVRRVAGEVDAHLRRPGRPLEPREQDPKGRPAADLGHLFYPRLYGKGDGRQTGEMQRTVVDSAHAVADNFFGRINRKSGDCLMLVVDADPGKLRDPQFGAAPPAAKRESTPPPAGSQTAAKRPRSTPTPPADSREPSGTPPPELSGLSPAGAPQPVDKTLADASVTSTAAAPKTTADGKLACIVCGAEAKTCCARCRSTHYCGRDCQKKHWKRHKPDCAKEVALQKELAKALAGPAADAE